MKRNYLFLFIFSLVFLSCTNNISYLNHKNFEDKDFVIITGSINKDSRIAYPLIEEDFIYEVSATSTESGQADTVEGSADPIMGTYSVQLRKNKVWEIKIIRKNSSGKELYWGTGEIDLSNPQTEVDAPTIYLDQISDGFASTKLPVGVEPGVADSCIVKWRKLSSDVDNPWDAANSQTLDFTQGNVQNFTMSDKMVATGEYEFQLNFYKNNSIVFSCNEFSYLVNSTICDSWSEAGSTIYFKKVSLKNTLYITKDCCDIFASKYYYVDNSGNDSNFGTSYSPFKTIQKAINHIEQINDETSTYTIYLKSDFMPQESDFTESLDGSKSLVIIDSNKNLSINISTRKNDISNINLSSLGRCFLIKDNVSLKVRNVNFENGLATDSEGGCIKVEGNSTIQLTKCIISNSNANNGGAIFLNDNANLIFSESLIESCYANVFGGAISSRGKIILTSGEISENLSENGNFGNGIEIQKGTIEFNIDKKLYIQNDLYFNPSSTPVTPLVIINNWIEEMKSYPISVNLNNFILSGIKFVSGTEDFSLNQEICDNFTFATNDKISFNAAQNSGFLTVTESGSIQNPISKTITFNYQKNSNQIAVTPVINGKILADYSQVDSFVLKIFYNQYDTEAVQEDNVISYSSEWIAGNYKLVVSLEIDGEAFSDTYNFTID